MASKNMKVSNGGVAEVAANPRIVPFKVIVCGLMRTGTLSMRAALRELGIHDVYHMQTTGVHPEDIPLWTRAIDAKYNGKGHFGRKEWDELLASHQAVTDIPASFFGVELANAYPEAKVIILNREPEKWYESCLTSIHEAFKSVSILNKLLIVAFDPSLRQFAFFMRKIDTEVQGFAWPEKEKALEFFNRYYKEWRTGIPQERILEYKVQDGWGPLCKHLGVPVPTMKVGNTVVERPFPRLNDGAALRKAAVVKMAMMRRRVAKRVLGMVQTLGLVALLIYLLVRRMSQPPEEL